MSDAPFYLPYGVRHQVILGEGFKRNTAHFNIPHILPVKNTNCAKYYGYSQPKIRAGISGNIVSQQVGLCKQMFFYVVHKNSFCAVSVCLQGLHDFM